MNIKTDKQRIRIETVLSVPPVTAWDLLTRQHHIDRWWGDHVKLDPKTGGRFREEWSDGGKNMITSGIITTFNPPSLLKMTWADDDWPGDTTVTFSLTKKTNGTHLRLDHSGWEIHPENRQKSLMDAHEQGWANYLHQIADYATTVKQ